MASLKAQLEQFERGWRDRVGPDIAGLVERDNAALRQQIAARAAKVGSRIPDVTLPNHLGVPTRIADIIRGRPTILTFYRGGWCPYCNLELRAYQEMLPQIREAGGAFVAISPERPDNAVSTVEKNALAFPVLSDVRGALSAALGLRFELSQEIVALYRKFGHDLPVHNGDDTWALPVPATFVVSGDGTIVLAHVEANYRIRLEPAEAMKALRNIG